MSLANLNCFVISLTNSRLSQVGEVGRGGEGTGNGGGAGAGAGAGGGNKPSKLIKTGELVSPADPACRPLAFSIVLTDREPGTG